MFLLITIILISGTHAYEARTDSPNVGTVLFSSSDLNRKQWRKDKIRLLQARKHLQQLIPPLHVVNTISEAYLTNLLSYFKESYKTVKREAKDPEVDNAMNLALSDALGGFLKVWVLPVTKYAYYGGAVSMEKTINMFQVYEDIKRKLDTDGLGWNNPDEDLLKSVGIDVVSRPKTSLPRSMRNSCKHLAFYEKTDTELTVPLPVINWDMIPITIFVPLENQSIIPISSPNSSKVLFHYYDIAENCMQAQGPTSLDDFNRKFQKWLSKNVAPHLKDDNLYLAFGSVLSLMNDTKNFSGIMSDTYYRGYDKIKYKVKTFGMTMCKSSKKYLIMILIILVEVIWCLPSLFYIMSLRKRKSNDKIKGFFYGFFKRKPKGNSNKKDNSKNSKPIRYNFFSYSSHKNQDDRNVKPFVKPRTRHLEIDAQNYSCDSKYMSIKSSKSLKNTSSSYQITVENEVKSSLRKILPEFDTSYISHKSSKTYVKNSNTNNKKNSDTTKDKKSNSNDHIKLESTKTLTFIQDETTIKEINYSQEKSLQVFNSDQTNDDIVKCKCVLSKNNTQKSLSNCPCTQCLGKDKQAIEIIATNAPKRSKFKKLIHKKQHKTIMHTETEGIVSKQDRVSKNKTNPGADSKMNFDKPILRIRIERPEAEIQVGITSVRKHSKPSKIPRLARKDIEMSNIKEKDSLTGKINDHKIIFQNNLRNITLDDTAVRKTNTLNRKLNVTL